MKRIYKFLIPVLLIISGTLIGYCQDFDETVLIREGNSYSSETKNQLTFSWNGGTSYRHAIKSRHHSGAVTYNSIDFYTWQYGQNAADIGNNFNMTLYGGRVGIGIKNPSSKLDINADALNGLRLKKDAESNDFAFKIDLIDGDSITTAATDAFLIQDDGTTYFKIKGTGETYIDNKLIAREVEIKQDVWADYVFSPEYQLMPLGALQVHIDQYGSLPNVPSSENVRENGVNLSEMNVLLLEKVEELILYTLKQQKEIDLLKKQIDALLNSTSD